jgi:hypothetical protein
MNTEHHASWRVALTAGADHTPPLNGQLSLDVSTTHGEIETGRVHG